MSTTELLELRAHEAQAPQIDTRFQVEIVSDETHGPLCRKLLAGERPPCFLGLSPETSYSNREQLTTILGWLGCRSEKILVLEGSYFSRWDLMVFAGLSQGAAEEKVRQNVQRFERRLRNVSTTLGLGDMVEPLRWPGVLELHDTRSIQASLRAYAQNNAAFSADVDAMLTEFLTRAHPTEMHPLSSDERTLLKNYVFEELSVFLHLCRTGYPLEVYPGSDLEIMQRIATNAYPGFPVSCPKRSHLSIRLTRLR